MKRVFYSIPLFFLLLPWLFIVAVIFGVSFYVTWHASLLLIPVAMVFTAAHHVHRQRSARDQHFVAAAGASAVLAAPLVLIVLAFFSGGRSLAEKQAAGMFAEPAFPKVEPKASDCIF